MSLYGFTGILDTPTARMMDDGVLAMTAETKRPDDRITIAFQALPWLEATARYAITYGYFGRGSGKQEYDRSVGLKLGLTTEGRWRPKIAVGIDDLGGTLVYGGEYVVASKRFGRFDTSLGLGWGRFGSTGMFNNPLGYLSHTFDNRTPSTTTGQAQFSKFFHGKDVSLFGGLVYNTPIRGLQLLAEYSGDGYTHNETGVRTYIPKTQLNFGLSYRPAPFIEFGVGWMYGRSLALRVSLLTGLKHMTTPKLDPPPLPIRVRREAQLQQATVLSQMYRGKTVSVEAEAKRPARSWGPAPRKEGFANAPDWTLYPLPSHAHVIEATYTRPSSPQDVASNVSAIDVVKAQLARLGLPAARVEIEGRQILFLIDTSEASPLPCDSIWPQLSTGRFADTRALTIASTADGGELYRCTKFITARPRLVGADGAAGTSAAITKPWWQDRSQIKHLAQSTKQILAAQGLDLETLKLTATKATVYYRNPTYQKAGAALGRAVRAMTNILPPSVETITLVATSDGINGVSVSFSRSELERTVTAHATSEELLADSSITAAEPGRPRDVQYTQSHLLHFTPIFAPGFRASLFDPDNPFRFQVRWRAGGTLEFAPGLYLQGVYAINLYNNFNNITRVSNSTLPHVRSDFRYYLQKGASGIDYLQLVGIKQLSPAWTSRISIGYLEEMYGGVAGEVLYHPFGARWALGASLADVWQRDYDKLFGFRHYHVATGHLSFYYQTPFHHIDLALYAGRYLAKDWGGTIQLSRRFDNGAEVGAFATFTTVPFSKFGEGSFDKGIFLRIPFDFFSLFSTKQVMSITLRPLLRDGGAMLNDGPQLWPLVRQGSYGATYRTWNDVLSKR